MFNTRFLLHMPILSAYVSQAQEHISRSRVQALMKYIFDALTWFDQNSSLQSVKLTCGALPESTADSIRVRHHFLLNGTWTGNQAVKLPAVEEYALESLPWQLLGNGSFELTRDDPAVQQFLRLDEHDERSSELLDGLLYSLASRMNAAIGEYEVIHDVGLRSAG